MKQAKIEKQIYGELLACPQVPPEMGGILAGINSVINTAIFDFGKENHVGIKYVPDVRFLNEQLLKVYREGKELYGMFHTHALQWNSLSGEDVKYIEIIMRSMPTEIDSLYFPIVFPRHSVKSYRVKRQGTHVVISDDKVVVV